MLTTAVVDVCLPVESTALLFPVPTRSLAAPVNVKVSHRASPLDLAFVTDRLSRLRTTAYSCTAGFKLVGSTCVLK